MRVWLKEARKKKNLTMRTMAAELGVSESNYCSIERGYRQKILSLPVASRISIALGIPLEQIMRYEDVPVADTMRIPSPE